MSDQEGMDARPPRQGKVMVWAAYCLAFFFFLRAGELMVSPKICILLTLWFNPTARAASTTLSAEVTGGRDGGAAQLSEAIEQSVNI